MSKGPMLFELDENADHAPRVTDAPPVPDTGPDLPQTSALQTAAYLASRKPSRLARLFWGLLLTLIGAMISLSAWRFVTEVIQRLPVIGWVLTGVIGMLVLVLLFMALREMIAVARLSRLDHLRRKAVEVLASQELVAARAVCDSLCALYRARPETRWGRERFAELAPDQLDAAGVLAVAERNLLGSLDTIAEQEIEGAVRRVATVTALVPLALVDVVAVLAANLRMIRRIAEVYGGRSGFISSWRLTRAVLAHLVATGAVAIGDDLIEPFVGSSVLGKISRRFGEGFVNGALTARVGIAAMEVCRPLPFSEGKKPKTRQMLRRALASFLGSWKSS